MAGIKAHNIYKILKWIFGWQGFSILIIILLIFGTLNSGYYAHYLDSISTIISGITDRLEKIIISFFTESQPSLSKYQVSLMDDSASQRIKTITTVINRFYENVEDVNWMQIIFGHGYQHFYVDSPIIQAFHDLGIMGFVIFTTLHIVIMRWVIKEIFNPTCDFTLMIAYVFLVTLIQNFTFGMPYDYGRWCALAFTTRFALSYKKISVESNLKTQNNVLPA